MNCCYVQEEDATLSAEDLQKKIERLTKLSRKKSEDFTFVNNTLRASDLGQDRFRLVMTTTSHEIVSKYYFPTDGGTGTWPTLEEYLSRVWSQLNLGSLRHEDSLRRSLPS